MCSKNSPGTLPEAERAKMPGVIVTLLLEINTCYEQGY